MTELEFNTFSELCTKEFLALQEGFKIDFNIEYYENWYYDQGTGLLTFSTGDQELNFNYLSVGTYSNNTKTWKWSWDNEHTMEKVKSGILKIRDFGIENSIKPLTTGQFEATEQDGWDFCAITAKLLNAQGAYRVADEHLVIFMILSEFVNKDDAQNIKNNYVSCGEHGSRRRAFICQHQNKHEKVGFEEAFETSPDMELEDDDYFQSWCNRCETEREKEGEWNDKSMEFANIRLVCESCYFEIKQLNLGYA